MLKFKNVIVLILSNDISKISSAMIVYFFLKTHFRHESGDRVEPQKQQSG